MIYWEGKNFWFVLSGHQLADAYPGQTRVQNWRGNIFKVRVFNNNTWKAPWLWTSQTCSLGQAATGDQERGVRDSFWCGGKGPWHHCQGREWEQRRRHWKAHQGRWALVLLSTSLQKNVSRPVLSAGMSSVTVLVSSFSMIVIRQVVNDLVYFLKTINFLQV